MPEPDRADTPLASGMVTFLFTDIEGSTRLWEEEPERMKPALARHDTISRTAVESHRGVVVKMTGDGVHAAFDDALDALAATVTLQQALADPAATNGVQLQVRCGLHAGVVERRDNDYFGSPVNRAARITSVAHGGQVLVSQAVVDRVQQSLPTGVSLRDLGRVRLKDLSAAEHVYQVLHPRLRQDFPALRSLEAVPNNLPQQVTTFVGREHDLEEVRLALGKGRLLTLSGIGGLGKTRLSLQIAAEVVNDYPDGVWFVEFAPITDERLVPQAVASVVAVKEEAGRTVVEALMKHVRDRKLLLVLDNCEHLVQACAELARQLLQAGAQVKILVSSREHFNIAGERIYTVPPLTVPTPEGAVSVEAILRYEAVRLFVERAMAVQPAFTLSEQNAPAVAEICRRLDGIPLALELAAARVRALSVVDIAARVNDRFQLLTAGDRTAAPRQQTLRALIDWSYDLLTERERILFRRLAVFAGGWTLDAAELVCAGGGVNRDDVLDLLTDLVDKSLVMVEPEGGWYRFLETVRQFAQERLQGADEGDNVRTQHLDFYVALAEKAKPNLVGPRQGEWLARLDLERENLLSAHRWADRALGGGEKGLRLANAAKMYWFNRGVLGLGHRVTVEALAREGASARSEPRSLGLFGAGQLCCVMGRYAEAAGYLQESLSISRERGDKRRIAAALQPLALVALGRGDADAAREYLEEGVSLAQGMGDKRDLASAVNNLAQVLRLKGELDRAEALYEQAVALARELDDPESVALGLLNLAMVAIGRGAGDRAHKMLLDALRIAEETGSRRVVQSVLDVSSGLASLAGEWENSAHFYGMADTQASSMGILRDAADEAFLTPQLARTRESMGNDAFAAAENAGRSLSYDQAIATTRAWLEARAQNAAPMVTR
jgi:predicted ATPase/class 3 adenylate cyclase